MSIRLSRIVRFSGVVNQNPIPHCRSVLFAIVTFSALPNDMHSPRGLDGALKLLANISILLAPRVKLIVVLVKVLLYMVAPEPAIRPNVIFWSLLRSKLKMLSLMIIVPFVIVLLM